MRTLPADRVPPLPASADPSDPPAPARAAGARALSPHTRATRLAHTAFAAAIVVQLLSSLVMATPLGGRPENVFFEIHEYGGLAALALAALFWVVALRRRRGTPLALLFPWFSSAGRAALARDARRHVEALRARTLPEDDARSPLAAAVHGLGLLLVSAMAASGAVFFGAMLAGASEAGWATLDIELHALLASLVWVYLIGHAGTALVHHFAQGRSLSLMWRP